MREASGRRPWALLCTLGLLAVLTAGIGTQAAQADGETARFETLEDFSGTVVGTMTGTVHDQTMSAQVDDVEYRYFDDVSSMILAPQSGQVDADVLDLPLAQLAAAQHSDLAIFPDTVASDSYGLGLAKGSPLTGQVSAIIERFQADGTLDALAEKWMGADESAKTIEIEDYDAPNGVLYYAHDSTSQPMSYVGDGGESLGYEVELVYLIARELGMELEIIQSAFPSLIPMLTSGRADLISGSISITEERRESIDFATAHYTGGVTILIRAEDLAAASADVRFQTLEDFSGATVAAFTGTTHDQILSGLVDGVEFQYYDDLSSQLLALQSGQVDAVINDLPVVRLAEARQPGLAVFPEVVAPDSYGLGLQKDSPLTGRVTPIIEGFRAEGTLAALAQK